MSIHVSHMAEGCVTEWSHLWPLLNTIHDPEHLPGTLESLLRALVAPLPVAGAVLLAALPPESTTYRAFRVGAIPPLASPGDLYRVLRPLAPAPNGHMIKPALCSLPAAAIDALHARSALLMPIEARESSPGLLVVPADRPDQLDNHVRERVAVYGYILAHVFSDVQTIYDLRTLLAAARDMAETQDLDLVLQRLLYHAIALTNTEAASILLQDARTGKLIFKAAIGPRTAPLREVRVPMNSIAGRTLRENRPLIVADVRRAAEHFRKADEVTGFHTRSLLAVPIHWRGQAIGVLEVLNRRDGSFAEHDLQILEALASQAAALIRHAQLATERERALEELRRLDERKTQFMRLASHELRTPLTVIWGYAEMLEGLLEMAERSGQALRPEEIRPLVEEVMNGVRRMGVVVDEITHAASLSQHTHMGDFMSVDLGQVVQDVLNTTQSWLQSKRLHLHLKLPRKPLVVHGDPDGLREAILQVVNNAIKFTPEHGSVEVAVWEDEGSAYVSVTDTGPGIPPEEHENIFQPFYQVENPLTRQHPGLGLGLSIAKRIVEEHGGRIWVESALGQGSTFVITLTVSGR